MVMYKRVLVATDGSEISALAVRQAVETASAFGADLVAMTVRAPFPFATFTDKNGAPFYKHGAPLLPDEYFKAQEQVATQRVQAVAAAAAEAGVKCDVATPESASPWETICKTADDMACDVIVMASHGRRGLQAILIGSETQKVLVHAKQPVLVVKGDYIAP